MMSFTNRTAFVFLLLPVFFSLGCSKGLEMVPVTGAVTYKGKPLEYGSVMFQPTGVEGAQTARGSIEPDGSFTLTTEEEGDGVAVGKSQIRITAFEAQRTNAQGNKHEEMALGKSAIPRRFQNFATSGIVIDVTPDMELPVTIDLDEY